MSAATGATLGASSSTTAAVPDSDSMVRISALPVSAALATTRRWPAAIDAGRSTVNVSVRVPPTHDSTTGATLSSQSHA